MRRVPDLLLILATVLIGYFGLLPLAVVVGKALSTPGLSELVTKVMSSSINQRALVSTVLMSGGTAIFALAVGVVLGVLVGGTDLPRAATWRSWLGLPYVVPAYITALAWIVLAAHGTGWINRAFEGVFGFHSPFDIYSAMGLVFVMGVTSSPLVISSVAETVSRLDYSVVEAARLSGAGPARAFKDAVWPLLQPAAFSSSLLVFLASSAAYGVPALLGPSSRPPLVVLTTRIKAMIDLHTTRGFTQAILMCCFLFALSLLFPLAQRWAQPSGMPASSRSARPFVAPLGRLRGLASIIVLGWILLTIALPFVTILVSSFLTNGGRGLAWDNFSLHHWKTVLGRPDVLGAVTNSLILGAAAATLAVALGSLLAYAESRSHARWKDIPGALISIPYATPGTVLAIGLILAFTGRYGPNLFSTLWILLIAYTVKEMALAYRMARVALSQVHPSLEEAARISGATRSQAFRDVIWPMVKSPLIAAWLLVFMPCFGELTMSILLFGPETQTVGTLLFELLTYEDPAAASVLAVLMLLVVGGSQMWIQSSLNKVKGRR